MQTKNRFKTRNHGDLDNGDCINGSPVNSEKVTTAPIAMPYDTPLTYTLCCCI